MKQFPSLVKLFVLISVVCLTGLFLKNLLSQDCVQCRILTAIDIIRIMNPDLQLPDDVSRNPKPPCCPPDLIKYLSPALHDTTIPIVGGYRIREILTINKDSTTAIYQIFVERIKRPKLSVKESRSGKK